jgi:hypothetical protein
MAGIESKEMESCTRDKTCEKVPMLSLQAYVDKFVKSKGLFRAGTVLDRTLS